jgi:hypothetical protein
MLRGGSLRSNGPDGGAIRNLGGSPLSTNRYQRLSAGAPLPQVGLEPTTLRLTVAAASFDAGCCDCLRSAENPVFILLRLTPPITAVHCHFLPGVL